MISTNTHPIRTLTWAVSTSWADAANGPLARVNICGIVNEHDVGVIIPVQLKAFLEELLENVQYVWLHQSLEVLVKPLIEPIWTWAFISR
jgi:hypothetical protein